MIPAQYDIEVIQGSDDIKDFLVTDPDGIPEDFTGCSAKLQARQGVDSSSAFLELTTENGGVILGGNEGTIEIIFNKELTSSLKIYKGVYDFEITSLSGNVSRYFEGIITINREVTR
ncbi:MAG: hypothetical protein R3D71_06035 [Rickettsiales bacterium]